MAGCLITEFARQGEDDRGNDMPIAGREVTTQAVTYTSSTQSAAFNGATRMVRVIADADVYLAFGANPTATATAIRLPANAVEYFAVKPGELVACYDGSS